MVMQKKYVYLAERLAQEIQSGHFQPGECLPGERKLAAQYGISHMTVNKAIASLVERKMVCRRPGSCTIVAEPTRCPNDAYVGLAIDADPVDAPSLFRVLPRLLRADDRSGLIIDLCHAEGVAVQMRQLVKDGVSVFIVDGHGAFPFSVLNEFDPLPRIVFVNRFEGPYRFKAAYVLFDYREAGRKAIRQLLAAGLRRIGLIGFKRLPGWTSELFYEGCQDMLSEAGLTLCGDWLTDQMESKDYAAILRHPDGVDGIVGVNDFRLIPFVEAAAKIGVRIPDDLALIGLGDTPHAAAFGLTALTMQPESIAEKAVDLLSRDLNTEILITPGLIERASCPLAAY